LILALQTTTFGAYGGIPTYNRCVCKTLNELENRGRVRVLVLTDTPADVHKHASKYPHLSLESFSGNKWAFLWRSLRTVLSGNPDLVLIGHVNHSPIGLMLKLLKRRIRYGVTAHGIEAWKKLPLGQRIAMRQADFVASVSEYTKRQLVELNGLDANRIQVVPDTLESQPEWNGNTIRSRSADDFVILTVCRLSAAEQYKGVDTVIRALPNVLEVVPRCKYIVIGAGNDLQRHVQLAREVGVSDRVEFRGWVDEEALHAAYEESDLFIMPSAGEGFGIVFLEAMHHRLPIIAARCTAVPEVVKDEVTGILVEYQRPDELSAAILRLANDSDLRRRMGESGRERLQQKFSMSLFQERWLELISGMTGPSRDPAQEREFGLG